MNHDDDTPYARNGDDRGHIWARRDNGAVDEFGIEADPHNGPRCVRCGYSYCEHCQDGPDEDCLGRDPFDLSDRGRMRPLVERMAALMGGAVTWGDASESAP